MMAHDAASRFFGAACRIGAKREAGERPALPPQLSAASFLPTHVTEAARPWEDGQERRPASQETCPDNMNVLGRGVPVVRLAAPPGFLRPDGPRPASALAFAPN